MKKEKRDRSGNMNEKVHYFEHMRNCLGMYIMLTFKNTLP